MAPVVLAAAMVLVPLGAAPAKATTTPVPTITPQSAQAFVDSVGVVTHFRYQDQTYAQSDRLLDSLQRLGVHHIRDGLPMRPSADLVNVFRELPQHDLKLNVVLGTAGGKDREKLPPAARAVAALDDAGIASSVESIESANEWDLRGGGWRAQLGAFQRDLYAAVHSDPELRDIPVVGPSTGRKYHVANLRGMSSEMDIANLHNYAAGGTPEDNLAQELAGGEANAPGKPLYVTETGYHTALAQRGRQKPVTDEVKADYLTRTLLENFQAGVARTYIYQLVDGKAEPANEDQEQHFGLLRADFSETPAYTQIRQLLGALADDGPAYTPQPLQVQVTSADRDVRHLVLQKRDGTNYVLLWKRGALMANGQAVAEQPADVSVSFGDEGRQVTRQDSSGQHDLGKASQLTGSLGSSAVLLKVGATAAAPGGSATITPTPTTPANDPGAESQTDAGSSWLPVAVAILVGLLGLGIVTIVRRRRGGPPRPPGADGLPAEDGGQPIGDGVKRA